MSMNGRVFSELQKENDLRRFETFSRELNSICEDMKIQSTSPQNCLDIGEKLT